MTMARSRLVDPSVTDSSACPEISFPSMRVCCFSSLGSEGQGAEQSHGY